MPSFSKSIFKYKFNLKLVSIHTPLLSESGYSLDGYVLFANFMACKCPLRFSHWPLRLGVVHVKTAGTKEVPFPSPDPSTHLSSPPREKRNGHNKLMPSMDGDSLVNRPSWCTISLGFETWVTRLVWTRVLKLCRILCIATAVRAKEHKFLGFVNGPEQLARCMYIYYITG
jgi:hypothetical protein